jgi:hypothetical protein
MSNESSVKKASLVHILLPWNSSRIWGAFVELFSKIQAIAALAFASDDYCFAGCAQADKSQEHCVEISRPCHGAAVLDSR